MSFVASFVTVECDVLVGFDLVAAENVSSVDRLLIARYDQRLSDAGDRSWRRRCFRLRSPRDGSGVRRSRFRLGRFRDGRNHGFDRQRLPRFGPVHVMQANALPPRGAEQFHGN
jgi:hypothetical protein